MLKFKKGLFNLEKLLFFLTILLLPTQLGKHFWPEASFIYSLRIDYLSPAIYFWDLLALALIATYSLSVYLGSKKTNLNLKAVTLFGIFLLTQFLSVIMAVNPMASGVRLKEYLIVVMFGVYIASVDFSEIKNYFFSGLFFAVLFLCLLGIAQFLAGHSIGFWILGERDFSVTTPLVAKFNFYDRVFLRPYATFSHPNLLGGFLILSLPILMAGISRKLNNLKLILGLLVSTTVLITFSRPALLLAGIQAVFTYRRLWKLILIFLCLVAPLLIVRFASIFTFDSLAVLRRQELADYAVDLFLKNPFFGIGLNNFINLLAMDKVLVGTSRFLQPVHNIFLLVSSETGVLGLAGFMALFIFAIWENAKKQDKLSKILTGDLLMVILLGFFDHYFITLPQGQRLLFLILGLSFNSLVLHKKKTET